MTSMKWRQGLVAIGTAVAALAASVPSASATQSASVLLTSKLLNTCSVTAVLPTMNTTTKVVYGTAKVKCSVSSTISVAMSVVELDGSVIDSRVQFAEKQYSITVRAGVDTLINTGTFTCASTDIDNEELTTRVKVSPGGTTWSAYDMVTPSNNLHPC